LHLPAWPRACPIGSELAGGAQTIVAERIHFKGTDQGIRIKSNRDRGHDVGT